uniref:ADF-H domain-containing protein n=1 Tax=Daphnia galeata TaxID=27404 RepID=A0A8J2WCH7_9CRUS|nr:unnamed protein product [Daphnia galeata]
MKLNVQAALTCSFVKHNDQVQGHNECIVGFQASGVTVTDACKQVFEKIKTKKDYRYVVFYIKDEKFIDVESTGDRESSYESFLEKLKIVNGSEKECRYGLFDFEYTHQCQGTQEGKKEKLFLMSWCPDDAKVKKKMLYSSSFDALKKALVGVAKYIQATDHSEASPEAVEEKLRSTDRM